MEMTITLFTKVCFIVVNALPVLTQVVSPGLCPSVQVEDNFDVSKYMGTWYEQEKYFAAFEVGQRCVTAKYSLMGNGRIRIINQGIFSSFSGDVSLATTGIGELLPSANNSAYLYVDFSGLNLQNYRTPNYLVLATDYESYSIVYSCTNTIFVRSEFMWILTRKRHPTPEKVENAKKMILGMNLNIKSLIQSNQTDCSLIDMEDMGKK